MSALFWVALLGLNSGAAVSAARHGSWTWAAAHAIAVVLSARYLVREVTR